MPAQEAEAWYLGIDLGTGSCKSVVIDREARVLGFGASEYPSPADGSPWQEQSPEALLEGMVRSVRAAIRQAGTSGGRCAGISLGGALHSLLPLDRHGAPLGPVLTWADSRAGDQAQTVKTSPLGATLYQQTGCPPHAMYPLYKLLWLRQEQPGIFRKAERFVSAKEFVFQRLTGQYWVDYSLAAGSGLLNTHNFDWDEAALDLAGIGPGKLSDLASPFETHAGLQEDLAARMGISPRTSVILGSSDAVNSSFGAGAFQPWQATCMIGTSGAFRISAPQPLLDPQARTWCYAIHKGRWLCGGAINNGGIAFSWLLDTFNQAIQQQAAGQRLTFEELLALAQTAPAGANGLICLPFFAGERSPNWNSHARAAFVGLSLAHGAGHLARALLEGVAYRMRSLHVLLADNGAEIRQIRASGGFTHSPLWLQIMADVLNRELVVPSWGETSSLGAALWALQKSRGTENLEELGARIALNETYQPLVQETKQYEAGYELYQQLYQALAPLFTPVVRLQSAQ